MPNSRSLSIFRRCSALAAALVFISAVLIGAQPARSGLPAPPARGRLCLRNHTEGDDTMANPSALPAKERLPTRALGVTGMDTPGLGVPAQYPSTRRVRPRDVVFAEITAMFWDYGGQVLRTFALGDPPPLRL